MKHNRYCKRESMTQGCFDSHVDKSTEMVQRKYLFYDGSQYVLWIVPELFHNYESKKIKGHITIQKKDGSIVQIDEILRTPYPNKTIRQLSTKVGRKRVYGIPLIFDTFEELCEITDIHIQWEIYSHVWLDRDDKKPMDLRIIRLDIVYHVNFSLNTELPEAKMFTIFSKDDALEEYYDAHDEDDYFDQFDVALSLEGTIESFSNDNPENDTYEAELSECVLYKGEDFEDTEALTNIVITECQNDFVKDLPDMELVRELANQTRIKHEIQYHKVHYERTETVTAEELPDILPEGCFGFRFSAEKNRRWR